MIGTIIGIAIGAFVIKLGISGFSKAGLPFSKKKRLTGTKAKVIGVLCFMLGGLFLLVCGLDLLLNFILK